MKNNKKGFTLIELLVVIAIIGLLSTLAVVSLNGARAKARDARRLSDVKQMSTILAIEAANNPATALTGCVLADDDVTICTGPGDISQFSKFADPSTPGTECTAASAATCQYSIVGAAETTSSCTIRFWLEEASGSIGAGLHTIDSEGIIT